MAAVVGLLGLASQQASAVPSLQLDILGGTYDTSTESIMSTSGSFSLYAYGLASDFSTTDTLYLAIALMPQTSVESNIGSFSFTPSGGSMVTVNVTDDMTYGVPPLETVAALLGNDGGDLGQHGVYETYFYEYGFTLSGGESAEYNTQDMAGSGPQLGTGMLYQSFAFNMGALPIGYGLHFDLYTSTVRECANNPNCVGPDIDADQFAPFSHDAQAMPIPEPETYAMLLAGLGLMGFVARRRRLMHTR